MELLDIVKTTVKTLDEKRASDIEVIDISKLSALGDYLIIATGGSSTQVTALADEVEDKLSSLGLEPAHVEGHATSWVLLDYHSVMIHVFHKDARIFYGLDRLWTDGRKLDISEFIK